MAKFEYTAKSKDGKHQSGTVEASSMETAAEHLTKQGMKPIVIKPAKSGLDLNNLSLKFLKPKKVRLKDMVVFTRQLSTMINAGVPLVRALATLHAQTENDYFREILAAVSKDVESGLSFADSLEKHPKAFSPIYVNMVRAGEAGGILDDILKRLALQEEKTASIKKKIRSASTYPAVLLVVTTVAFFGMMIFVIPKIGSIIKNLGGEDTQLPVYTRAMLSTSDFIINRWYRGFARGWKRSRWADAVSGRRT